MSSFLKIAFSAVLLMFSALASAEPVQPQGPSGLMQLIFFGGFIVIFYFLMWRPQSKRAKEHRDLVAGIGKGDEVVIGGGIVGKVTKVTDDFISVEVSDGVEIKVQKHAVTAALPKGTLKSI